MLSSHHRRPGETKGRKSDGYTGFLFLDDKGLPLVAMHWEHRFNHMVKRYNDIYRVQMPNITPHVCRHTYCSNMAKSGMNPKTLQYLIHNAHEQFIPDGYSKYWEDHDKSHNEDCIRIMTEAEKSARTFIVSTLKEKTANWIQEVP